VPKPHESSIDPEKREIIENICFNDRTGYRSVRDTSKKETDIDPSIKLKGVSQWKAELQPKKTQVSGYNSVIANVPFSRIPGGYPILLSTKGRQERGEQDKEGQEE